jgi:GNAT superfamily N-acetyltransferase
VVSSVADYDIRLAIDDDERAAVYRLRYELYVEGKGLFRSMADHERRWLCDRLDAHASIWVARVGDEIVGTGRSIRGGDGRFDDETRETFGLDTFAGVVDERDIALASRLVVAHEHRGGGLPVMLMARAWARLIEDGAELAVGECVPSLVDNWSALGYRPYGICEHADNDTRIHMAFVLGDVEHVHGLGSPLASVVSRYAKSGDIVSRLREVIERRGHAVIGEVARLRARRG